MNRRVKEQHVAVLDSSDWDLKESSPEQKTEATRTNLWDNSRRRRGFPSLPPGRAGCPRPAGLLACTATLGFCSADHTPQGTAPSPWTTAPCRRPPTGFRWAHRSRPPSPGYTPTSSLEVTEVQKGKSRRKRSPYPPDLPLIFFALRHESLFITQQGAPKRAIH